MSTQIWLTSDLHLFHKNMLRGEKIGIRPFDTIEQMHEAIITGWNSVVKEGHKVYMLGDLTLGRHLDRWGFVRDIVMKLAGRKRLLLGNHDHYTVQGYHDMGFEKVLAYRELGGLILSHIPVHVDQMKRYKGNVHGHLHNNVVMCNVNMGGLLVTRIDNRYVNVCVERTNYTPVNFDEVRKGFV